MAKNADGKKVLGRVFLKDVRLSFADSLFEAKSQKQDDGTDGPEKHHCNFLIPKKTTGEGYGRKTAAENMAKLKAAKEEVMLAFPKWRKIMKLEPHLLCTRDGDLKEYDGYEDMWYVSAGTGADRPPKLVDHQKRAVTEAMGLLYGGCWVNASVKLWCQDNKKGGKRVNATLEAVQFLRHDDMFGAAPVDLDEAFEDLSESGEVQDLDNSDSGDDLI